MDAVLARFVLVNNMKGVWQNSNAYVASDRVVDPDTGTIYTCSVPHTSAATPTTFEEDRVANPTFWTVFTFSVQFRGDWASGEDYAVGDFVVFSRKLAIATTSHTAGSSFATDQGSGKWNVLIDGDVLTDLPTLVAADEDSVLRVNDLGQYELAVGVTIDDSGNVTAASVITDLVTINNGGEIAFGNALAAQQTRANLGVVIGTDVQTQSDELDAVAALADTGTVERTGAATYGVYDVTAFAKTVLDDSDAATARATLGAIGNLKSKQIFTASGTYTKPSELKYAKVICTGGGAGGGAGSASVGGGGGGAGGTGIKYIAGGDIGSSETVTVGAGGASKSNGSASSFGAHITTGSAGNGADGSIGGSGSTSASADINLAGGGGAGGNSTCGGNGGSSYWGSGGRGWNGSSVGEGAGAYGSGGGGSGPAGTVGGAGAGGIVVVEEYF